MTEQPRIGVVGGGPAGGFCAFLLGRAGFSVVLFERHPKVERKVCGEYLAPAAGSLFAQAGLPVFFSERFPSLEGIVFHLPEGISIRTHFPAVGGRSSLGYALDRVVLESELLRLGAENGVDVRMGSPVRAVEREEKGWNLLLESGARERVDLLIGADGRHSIVAKSLGLHENLVVPRVALHSFLPGNLPDSRYGQMHFFTDGTYLGLNASPAGNLNVSVVCDVGAMKRLGGAEKAMAHYLDSPALRKELSWDSSLPVLTTYPVNHSVARATASRAVLIGDAGGIIDPLTGEGIYLALWSAQALSEQLKKWRERGAGDPASFLRAFAKLKARQFRWKNRLSVFFQWVLRRPKWMRRLALYLGRKPSRADAFIGMMGHLYSPAVGIRKILWGEERRAEDIRGRFP